ncbi:hypothetical protein [Gloeocapsa sp. PCC 73106]|uniref:hypothetical protein n=1 Tax=Gloeocapsa sp. PCC 73106 TaxID=102232 RepID=UPI0002AC73A7|nr:hypothetical protein [Gloeocapsa sp. PCC 73106]ELR96585.1 hypothetical protein GLO73106DRAFT_00003800 [Gloeocapsa sp. PCC 73106]
MKIQEKVEILESQYIQPQQLGIILLTILSSFVVGLIPMVATMETTIIPSEAGLWVELGEQ